MSRALVLLVVAASGAVLLTPLGCSVIGGASEGSSDGPGATAYDGRKNGDESDVDCGGSAAKCADGRACARPSDCASGVCKGSVCAPPSPDDGVKNGDETDVDCGGAKAPKCATGQGCKTHGDCASDACAYDSLCVDAPSCTGHFGGDTCGAGETGAPGAQHESCCARVAVTDRPDEEGGAFWIDKYLVTAGRMRAFVERWGGDLKAWAATSPPGWDDAWTDALPGSAEEALWALGPGNKRGCSVQDDGGRTYWQPPVDGDDAEVSDFGKDVLDEKALNCVPWHLAQALCVSDGGRLASNAEIAWVFENRGRDEGPTEFPWGFRDASGYDASSQDERLAHRYNYATPNPPPSMRLSSYQGTAYPLDKAFYIAPPGRFPMGANMHGVEDAAGNLLVWVSDEPRHFTWTMSWEEHPKNLTPERWKNPEGPDGYYAIGARCARDD